MAGRTVAIATLGCKVNQFESASFQSGLEQEGISLVSFSQPADIYVINTCAVTARACAQSRQLIRRARRANPAARLVVTGCYSQVAPEEIKALAATSLCLVGNSQKDRLVETITNGILSQGCDAKLLPAADIRDQRRSAARLIDLPAVPAYLKIQDGCDSSAHTASCPGPRPQPSPPVAETISQAEAGARQAIGRW
jgi:threonylcarbamoyladenosine tRNA methylthiotransferase MtaB